uniref:Uncharacterized protein n=1 Tax=Arundo donax TaxID=35708 RepID=A0A0A9H6H9_ARUDO
MSVFVHIFSLNLIKKTIFDRSVVTQEDGVRHTVLFHVIVKPMKKKQANSTTHFLSH